MSNEDYQKGFKDGFELGLQEGKKLGTTVYPTPSPSIPSYPGIGYPYVWARTNSSITLCTQQQGYNLAHYEEYGCCDQSEK